MRRSIIGCAIVFCFFSPSLFAGDVRVTVRKAGGGQIQKTDSPATVTNNAFEKKKQELKDIVDQIAKLRGHAASIDWGDGTPPPSLTVTIDWGDGTPPSSLTVTNVVARLGSDPDARHHIRKYLDQTTPNLAAPVAEQGDIRRPQQPSPDEIRKTDKPATSVGKIYENESPRPQDRRDLMDEIQKAKKLVADYNSKRDAYALEKPSGSYFAALPRLEVDPIELKTNTAAAGAKQYVVWVYKSEGGQWVKQPDRTLNTDDAKAATDYVDQINAMQGWTATTNVPEDLYMHRKLPGKMKSGQLSGKTKNR